MTNFLEDLPPSVRRNFEELHPLEKNELRAFLNRTEWCQDLYYWHSRKMKRKAKFNKFLIKNGISYSTFKFLQKVAATPNFHQIQLAQPIQVGDTYYTKVFAAPPPKNIKFKRIYINYMDIFLVE